MEGWPGWVGMGGWFNTCMWLHMSTLSIETSFVAGSELELFVRFKCASAVDELLDVLDTLVSFNWNWDLKSHLFNVSFNRIFIIFFYVISTSNTRTWHARL